MSRIDKEMCEIDHDTYFRLRLILNIKQYWNLVLLRILFFVYTDSKGTKNY